MIKKMLRACLCISYVLLTSHSWAGNQPELMLASVLKPNSGIDLSHYWVSEKYDGVRAFWDGSRLISRQGNEYHAPSWFVKNFPKIALDGELWLERGRFDQLSGIVRKQIPHDSEWLQVRYMVFDMPTHSGTFDQRLHQLALLKELPSWLEIVKQWRVDSEATLLQQLDSLVEQGAEGLMLHDGRSLYSAKRNDDLIKLKPSLDSEAVVLSYVEGKGKYQGKMGALWVEAVITDSNGMSTTKRFKIGSGFSDKDREQPPAIGAEITFKYSGLTSRGIPRFARYWRIRN